MITIERCGAGDVDGLMQFIDTHWRRGHALATSRELLDWQHKCPDGTYNFLLAKRDLEILGILGYIPTSRYDPAVDNLVWLALWKVRDGAGVAGLGLRMLSALYRIEPAAHYAVNGINPSHPPMYRSLGYDAAELSQYYFVNPNIPQTLIVDRATQAPSPTAKAGRAIFSELTLNQLTEPALNFSFTQAVPGKSATYFANRFLRHPFYSYRVFAVDLDGVFRALVATRISQNGSAQALRIVDFLGDEAVIAECGTAVGDLLEQSRAEYVDFWQYGLSDEYLLSAGFVLPGATGAAVPTYFEPFTPVRGRIIFAVKTGGETIRIFRADGDQDRPNVVRD